MTREEKLAFINASAWFHKIPLGEEICTPGLQDCAQTLRRIHMPPDLSGRTVLDVGANDGYFSFEAKRRGAARVVALDTWERKYDQTQSIDNIRFCAQVLDLEIEIVQADVLDYQGGPFDVVLFMGVLYHMQDPLAGLRKVARLARDLVIVESHVIDGGPPPMMRYYPGAELNRDPTNWWGPNESCLKEMVATAGMQNIVVMDRTGDRLSLQARGCA